MLSRLTARWQYITRLYEKGDLGEDVNDTQEVLEDLLNRSLTREYLEVLKVALIGGTLPVNNAMNEQHAGSLGTGMDCNDEHSMDSAPATLTRAAQSAMSSDVINDLGAKLLRYPYTSSPTVMTILR